MKKYVCIALAIVVIGLSGCKPKQTGKRAEQTTTPVKALSAQEVVSQTIIANNEIKNINIANAEAMFNQNGKPLSIRFNIKIVKGKEIAVSVSPILGVELYRIQIKPDNFYIFDKLHRSYCESNYKQLSSELGMEVSYNTIEALLVNQLFTLSNRELGNAFSVEQLTEKFVLKSMLNNNIMHTFDILPDYTISATNLKRTDYYDISVNYDNFEIVDKVKFPQAVDIKMISPKALIDLKLYIKKIKINDKDLEIGNIDISRYSRAECTNLF
jgi:hypothetical protein